MVTLRSGIKTYKEACVNTPHKSTLRSSNGNIINSLSSSKEEVEKVNMNQNQWITFLSLIIDLLSFTVILPLFPAILDYYSKNDSSGLYSSLLTLVQSFQKACNIPEKFNSVLFGGLLGSLFSLLQFVSSPITGALSDIYGRKPVLLLSLIGIASSYGLWIIASNFAIFIMARIIGGLSKGNVSLSYSIMADVSAKSNRAFGMALIGIAFSIGFILGPAIGAAFSKWGTTGWFSASASYAFVLAFVNILFTLVFFTETLPKSVRCQSMHVKLHDVWMLISPISLFSFSALKSIRPLQRNVLKKIGFIYFMYIFIYSGLEFTLTFVTHHYHGYSSIDQGKMFAYIGIVMAIVQGGYIRRQRPGKEMALTKLAFVLMIPAFILIGSSTSGFMFYIGLTLYAVGSSIVVPCLTSIASLYGSESEMGTLLGIWRSLGAFARTFGPVVTCIGFWYLGSAWCYSIGGILLLLPFSMLIL